MRAWILVFAVGCSAGGGQGGGSGSGSGSGSDGLPPAGAHADYQLGSPYPPPSGVQVVSRDHNLDPAPGLYNICYVNAFQIQPADAATWQAQHPDLILRDDSGNPLIDPNWNEMLVDVSTPTKRMAVAGILADAISGCKDNGFDAVEIDNLDSYTRSGGRLTADDAVAMEALFASTAHDAALAVGQKNAPDLVVRKGEMGTDFAIVEQCDQFHECPKYTDGYSDHVIVIEYDRADFDTGCAAFPQLSIVLRDEGLTTPGNADYVYDGC